MKIQKQKKEKTKSNLWIANSKHTWFERAEITYYELGNKGFYRCPKDI